MVLEQSYEALVDEVMAWQPQSESKVALGNNPLSQGILVKRLSLLFLPIQMKQ